MSNRAVRSLLSQTGVATTAIVALVASVVGLLFQLAPQLRPDPRDRVGAEISVFAVEPGATLGEWIARGFPPERQEALRRQYSDQGAGGELLYVRMAVDGHKHRDVALQYDVHHASNGQRVAPEDIDGPTLEPLELSSPSERSVQMLWIPSFRGEPDVFIRVALWDGRGMLAVADSARIHDGRLLP